MVVIYKDQRFHYKKLIQVITEHKSIERKTKLYN